MNAAQELINGELYEEAATFLESQPDPVLQVPAVQEEIRKVRAAWESEVEILQLVGTAYAALDNLDLSGGWAALEAGLQSHPESLLLKRARENFGSRMRGTADRALSLALTQARAALAAGDSCSAVDRMRSAADIANHASLELQGERQQLLKEAQRGRMFSRIGIRRNRSTPTQPAPEE